MSGRICHPLIKFPDEDVRCVVCEEGAEEWGVSSMELARMLGISVSAVRQALHRRGVGFKVGRGGRYMWDRGGVFKWVRGRAKVAVGGSVSGAWVPADEACALLGCVRSYLYKLACAGRVRVWRCMVRSGGCGMRVRVFYLRGDLEHVLGDGLGRRGRGDA